MKRLFTILILLFFTLPFIAVQAQEQLNFTALKVEGYGVYAHVRGHDIPLPVCGLDYAYYALESAEISNAGYQAAMHLVAGGTGFANFKNELTAQGYTIDQVEMTFTQMDLGADQYGPDWFISNDVETRMYRGGNYTFKLDGHDLVTGPMPDVRIEIDYNSFSNCGDDVIYGHSMYTSVADASAASPQSVKDVAAAFLADVGNAGIKLDFVGMQPAGQGAGGAVFEAQSGTVTKGPVFNNIFQNVATAGGTANQCLTANVSANSSGSGDWIHIEHNDDLVCSILDTENMGTINASIFVNTDPVRVTANGTEYLDRNFEISVTNQPTGTVRVRIYFKVGEWEAFLAANDNDGNDIDLLANAKVTKFSGVSCSNAVNSSGGDLLPIVEWGTSSDGATYYIDVEVTSFSAFFIHGGPLAVLPVELVYFSAQPEENRISLKWMTAYEMENDRFEVERSTDGFSFEKIGTLPGAGTRDGWQHYAYLDEKVQANQTYYYRLRQIDRDGTYEYSGIAEVKLEGHAEVSVFPNPIDEIMYVQLPEEISSPVGVELVNGLGQVVFTQLFEQPGTHEISTIHLVPGMYEIVFVFDRHRSSGGKVVKQY